MPAAYKLSFAETVSESFRFFFGNVALFFHMVTIPWVMSLVIHVVCSSLGGNDDSIVMPLAEQLLDFVPTVMFLVGWTRVVLLGPRHGDTLPGLRWSRRETAYLFHLVQVAGVTYLLLAVFAYIVAPFDPSAFATASSDPEVLQRQALAAPLGAGFLASAIMALRVCYGLAATTVDIPFSPRLSWAYGKGNGWAILATLFLMFVIAPVITNVAILVVGSALQSLLGPGLGVATVIWTVALLAGYAGTALIATTQAIIFRRLTGWRQNTPLPPPTV